MRIVLPALVDAAGAYADSYLGAAVRAAALDRTYAVAEDTVAPGLAGWAVR